MVEQGTHKPFVVGSTPTLATFLFNYLLRISIRITRILFFLKNRKGFLIVNIIRTTKGLFKFRKLAHELISLHYRSERIVVSNRVCFVRRFLRCLPCWHSTRQTRDNRRNQGIAPICHRSCFHPTSNVNFLFFSWLSFLFLRCWTGNSQHLQTS